MSRSEHGKNTALYLWLGVGMKVGRCSSVLCGGIRWSGRREHWDEATATGAKSCVDSVHAFLPNGG